MKRLCPKTGDELTPMPRGAYKCTACGGMFVPRMAVELIDDAPEAAAGQESYDAQTGRCPMDGSMLSRAEIDLGDAHSRIHLDRCASCRGVWFDAGEWSTLAELELLRHIDEFWTVEWRAAAASPTRRGELRPSPARGVRHGALRRAAGHRAQDQRTRAAVTGARVPARSQR